MIPRHYQLACKNMLLEAFIKNQRVSLCMDPGLGKTLVTLLTFHELSQWYDVFPVLVLAPLRVARDVWHADAEKSGLCGGAKMVRPIIGTPAERIAILKQKANIYTINYEAIPWLMRVLGGDFPFKHVVCDESTKLKSFRTGRRKDASRLPRSEDDYYPNDEPKAGVRAAQLRKAAFTTGWWLNLTGTPMPNGALDLWGPTWFLDFGERLGATYSYYNSTQFKRNYNGTYAPVNMENIMARINDIYIQVDAKTVFGVDDPIEHTIDIALPKDIKRQYRELERELYLELEKDATITAVNAVALANKCHQFVNGASYVDVPYGEQKKWENIHDEKLNALQDLIEELNGAPVLVVYGFKHDLIRIQKRFPKSEVISSSASCDKWNRGEIQIGLVHPASTGHGLNFQYGGNIMIFFSHTWNLEHTQQIMARIGPVRQKQAGFNRPSIYYYLVVKGTIDEDMRERTLTKASVQDTLRRRMRQVTGDYNA